MHITHLALNLAEISEKHLWKNIALCLYKSNWRTFLLYLMVQVNIICTVSFFMQYGLFDGVDLHYLSSVLLVVAALCWESVFDLPCRKWERVRQQTESVKHLQRNRSNLPRCDSFSKLHFNSPCGTDFIYLQSSTGNISPSVFLDIFFSLQFLWYCKNNLSWHSVYVWVWFLSWV